MMSEPYPIFINLAQRPVLLVGAGRVALRKAEGLLRAGAALTVVAPMRREEFAALPEHRYEAAAYASAMMVRRPRWALAFAATDVTVVNEQVVRDAQAAGILCCRCDDPEGGDFAGGAVLRQPGLMVAVSTQGASPALAVRLRDAVGGKLDPVLLELAGLLAQWRREVLEGSLEAEARRQLLLRLAGTEMEEILRIGGAAAAQQAFGQWRRAAQAAASGGGAGKAEVTDEA